MQIIRVGYGVRGFRRVTDYAIRWSRMVTKKAEQKAKILAFFQKHGPKITQDAFGVSRRALYLWKAALKQGGGKTEALNEKSRRPVSVRLRIWPEAVKENIRHLRAEHPNLGKDKIHPLLKRFCDERHLVCPSQATIGRIIGDDPKKMRTFPVKVRHSGKIIVRKRKHKERKPKHFKAEYPGHCGSFDTIEFFLDGCRRYVLTFTDVYSRFSFAWATRSHASLAAKEFLDRVSSIFPYRLQYVLTDNGSEFAKDFDLEIKRQHKVHWHTYPKTPKMNPHDERFNRTIQEEFINFHYQDLLLPEVFNKKLMEYLIWFDGERPHFAHGQKSPIQFLTEQNPQECNMWWTHTNA